MKEILTAAAVAVLVMLVVSYNLAEGRQAYRDCLATQERMVKSSDQAVLMGCYR